MRNKEGIYFITFATVGWVDVLREGCIRMFSLIVLNTAHALIKISYKCTINGQILIFQ